MMTALSSELCGARPRGVAGRHAAKVSGTAVYSRRVGRSSHVVETLVPFPKEHASTTAEHSSNILLRGRVANGEAPQNRSHLKNAENPRCVCGALGRVMSATQARARSVVGGRAELWPSRRRRGREEGKTERGTDGLF